MLPKNNIFIKGSEFLFKLNLTNTIMTLLFFKNFKILSFDNKLILSLLIWYSC